MKILRSFKKVYGVIGIPINFKNLCVGDIAIYEVNNNIKKGLVVKDPDHDFYSIYGWVGNDLSQTDKYKVIGKYISYESLNYKTLIGLGIKDIDIYTINNDSVKITIKDIEKILGYKIQIVSE